jgi:hypothetical protein
MPGRLDTPPRPASTDRIEKMTWIQRAWPKAQAESPRGFFLLACDKKRRMSSISRDCEDEDAREQARERLGQKEQESPLPERTARVPSHVHKGGGLVK